MKNLLLTIDHDESLMVTRLSGRSVGACSGRQPHALTRFTKVQVFIHRSCREVCLLPDICDLLCDIGSTSARFTVT